MIPPTGGGAEAVKKLVAHRRNHDKAVRSTTTEAFSIVDDGAFQGADSDRPSRKPDFPMHTAVVVSLLMMLMIGEGLRLVIR